MSSAKDFGCGCAAGILGLMGACVVAIAAGAWLLVQCGMLEEDAMRYGKESPECEKPLEKVWAYGTGDEDAPQIVCVPIRGVIAAREERASILEEELSGFEKALSSIRAATRDDDILGLCLILDTPGGTVTDADILADAIQRFKKAKAGRFVFALMRGLCCSGGYYVAAGADYIMAHPTTLTGSIGVIMNGFNAAGLAEKIGVKSVVIATGENKALLDPLSPVNPKHVEILKRPVSQDYERFLSIVSAGRHLSVEQIRPLADGRVLSAQDALNAKLIDGIGYAEDAWAKIAELAKAKEVRIYRYEEPFSLQRFFFTAPLALGESLMRGVKGEIQKPAVRAEYMMH